MSRILEIEISCCGDCPYYDWKNHRCTKGATDEGKAQEHFYKDCPLNWREVAAKPIDKNIAQSGLAPATENFELMEG